MYPRQNGEPSNTPRLKNQKRIKRILPPVVQLTPSLLAKAFRGELVEQDPNDEPEEKLLERIRMERDSKKIF
jgi:hypothetical protein